MKLFLRTAVLACCVLLTATGCIFDVPIGLTTVTIDKSALYDELGITGAVKEALDRGDGFLVDSLLVYDEDGLLVTKLGEESDNLNPLILEMAGLPDGRYTLVAWQTMEAYTKGKKGSCWAVHDEELLSTVSITSPYDYYRFLSALGYATAEVTVYGGMIDVDLSPRSMGAIVDVWVDHFTEESEYPFMYLETTDKQQCNGFRLDPALDEAERWMYIEKYGCFGGIHAGESREKFYVLAYTDGLSIDFWAEKEDGEDFWFGTMPNGSLQIDRQYIGYIDMGRWWLGPFFGTPEDFAVWKADRDAGILAIDPLVKWGCDLDEVEQFFASRGRYYEPCELVYDEGWKKEYDMDGLLSEDYHFETEDGQGLFQVCCYYWTSFPPVEMVHNTLLHQGYLYKGKIVYPGEEQKDYYVSSDGLTQVLLSHGDDESWKLIYQPAHPDDLQYIIDQPTKSADNHEIVSQISRPRVLRAADGHRMHIRRSYRNNDRNHQ